MWGTPICVGSGCRLFRFIPACVGNSSRLQCVSAGYLVSGSSPRVWGTLVIPHGYRQRHGSSPRVWGTQIVILILSASHGWNAVHPRVCGELCHLSSYIWTHPRVCGKIHCATVHPRVCGELKLACVGCATVHPRVCGELSHPILYLKLYVRFIPACVGNSLCWPESNCQIGSSPRVWGTLQVTNIGSWWQELSITKGVGSSPRVWGTPACVWNVSPSPVHPRVCGELTRCNPMSIVIDPVHPRVCGERFNCVAIADGSSPRVWGTPLWFQCRWEAHRFIPACVGNSFR